ncbi:recombination mediator RecR [Spiroplasma sp. SV19]|uniref:recombination mediator RecR n=1 Tax=Spiroplasma sp. SV19 TaxID=2570468 RepID=UPI0024B78849|nr:recombination mediator RecR [Spiroplasma sp. SV19]WHQ37144.1 recombination protein RecR [Spiroplasma sp. SV19]
MTYEELIMELKTTLGVGKKVAERIFNKLIIKPALFDSLENVFKEIKDNFHQCPRCSTLMQNNICLFCQNDLRDQTKLCVVSNFFDATKIEATKVFNGVYHVLNGEINVKNGITPDKLTFPVLESRMNDKIIKEVIIAVGATFEGEVTAQYLKTVLQPFNVKISRLARGIPIGGSLDYVDEVTLKQALEGRKDI